MDFLLRIEGARVSAQVRLTHLKKQGRDDPFTREQFEKVNGIETEITNKVKKMVESHPAYPWFSRIRGVGLENIAKVVGLIDIRKADHISSLWKFAGYHVVDGKAPRRVKGKKLDFNAELRVMCYRLGQSLIRAGAPTKNKRTGKERPASKFYQEYEEYKNKKLQEFKDRGYKIVPATELPEENGKKYEPPGVISEGHIHMMAFRRMMKIFLASLWLVWREAEGLPVSRPWVLEHGGHVDFIDPWSLCDRKERRIMRVREIEDELENLENND